MTNLDHPLNSRPPTANSLRALLLGGAGADAPVGGAATSSSAFEALLDEHRSLGARRSDRVPSHAADPTLVAARQQRDAQVERHRADGERDVRAENPTRPERRESPRPVDRTDRQDRAERPDRRDDDVESASDDNDSDDTTTTDAAQVSDDAGPDDVEADDTSVDATTAAVVGAVMVLTDSVAPIDIVETTGDASPLTGEVDASDTAMPSGADGDQDVSGDAIRVEAPDVSDPSADAAMLEDAAGRSDLLPSGEVARASAQLLPDTETEQAAVGEVVPDGAVETSGDSGGGEASTDSIAEAIVDAPAAAANSQEQSSNDGGDPAPQPNTGNEPPVVVDSAPAAGQTTRPTTEPATNGVRVDGAAGVQSQRSTPAPAAATPVTAPRAAEFDGEVWEQVQKAVNLVRQNGPGRHEVNLVLRPDELGSVSVELVQRGDEVAVRIVTQTAAAQDRLDRARLLTELQSAGIDPTSVDIAHQQFGGTDQGRGDGGAPGGSPFGETGSGTDHQPDDRPVRRSRAVAAGTGGGLDLQL